jgi:hypothetical protein
MPSWKLKMLSGNFPVKSTIQNVTNERMADQIPTKKRRKKCGMPIYNHPKRVRRMSCPREYFS